MAKTTIVIPNYKGIDYIDNCLSSIYKGTVIPNVIMVDNNSKDGSLALVKEKYCQVKIIEFTDNMGFCRAVNAGIKAADTPYVLLLNNDTEVDNHMVSCLEQALENDRKVFSAAAKMINLHAPERLDGAGDFYCAFGWAFARGKDKPAEGYDKPCRIFSACAGAAIYRREVFDNIGYFDENHFAYLEDLDIGYRADIYGYHNKYVPEAKVYHAGSAATGSRHNAFKVTLSARNNIYLIYKNMPLLQFVINLPLLAAGHLIKFVFFLRKGLGRAYLAGILQGFRMAFSKQGRKNKVRFAWRNLPNYFWIQGQLWGNIVRRGL